MKKLKKCVALPLLTAMLITSACASEQTEPSVWNDTTTNQVSVHDPSITYVTDENGNKTYYIFGSHVAEAKSADLISWAPAFQSEYENMEDNILYGDTVNNLAESFAWAGYDDADSSGGYAIWAPDVIWNEDYDWGKGAKGAYMLYYSASSTWKRSCIGFAVSRYIEGPYEYSGTVVYSGFTELDSVDGSSRNTNYENTNLSDLIADGTISGFSDNWSLNSGRSYNTDYAPNAIDPALFYDEDGRLWMTYGSWSGGIYILEIDPATGIPIYPGQDSQTNDGRIIDRYFGTKLMGGYHQSGEGPYIVYDQSTGYYYLFVTYGSLTADGGYNMRLFRSESPDGSYVDAQGNMAILEKGDVNSDYGIKLMGNYKLSSLTRAYKSPGHNSAFIDDDGQWYLVYHTRFDSGTEYHEVRVHQMFMNEDGWPVTAVYEYAGDQISQNGYSIEAITGTYQFINHGTQNSTDVLETLEIALNADGTVSGAISGTWQITSGYNMRMDIDGIIYSGIFYQQKDESFSQNTVMTFTAIGSNNETIWGSTE